MQIQDSREVRKRISYINYDRNTRKARKKNYECNKTMNVTMIKFSHQKKENTKCQKARKKEKIKTWLPLCMIHEVQ